jgi:hypothetical protein
MKSRLSWASTDSTMLFISSSFHSIDVPEQTEVQDQTNQTGNRSWKNHGFYAAEVSIRRRAEKPKLKNDDRGNDRQDAVHDDQLLMSGKRSPHARTSTPVA